MFNYLVQNTVSLRC